MRVLYVDDDPAMTAAVEQMLASEGYDCDAVALGKRAVEIAKRNKYDVILLDIMMPDIDGYEVVERVRKAGVRTPILVQSGLVDRDNDMEGLWLGTSEYLIKPFNKGELIERIEAVLSRSASTSVSDPVYAPDAGAPTEEGREQRRRHRRFDTVQPGRILHGRGIDCIILDMSYGGAAIQISNADIDCPESFELQLQSGSTLRCQARWRSGDRIGVQVETQWPEEVVGNLVNQFDPAAEAPASPVVEPAQRAEAVAQVGREPEAVPSPRRARPVPTPPQDAPISNRQVPTKIQPEGDRADDPQVFAVDRGIHLVAESCECAELVVEGYLEATARAQSLRVGPDGRFVGAAEVAVAEIHGHVEGDLTVTGKLVIHPTGRVSGTTRYRQIAMESGGRILGEVRILSQVPVVVPEDERDLRQAAPAA